MTKFKKLTVQNFLGFGEVPVEFQLDFEGTTLIRGHNGAGKTTILNAVSVAMYGKGLTNGAGKVDDLINNINLKRMLLILEFEKDKVSYTIHRARKMVSGAAGNYVKILRGKKDITPDSIANGNKLIEDIIGIPYELFIRVATISATYEPFLSLPVKATSGACQTDIIEELFDLKSLTTKGNILKDQIKETKTALSLQHAKREALQQERERHAKQLVTAKQRLARWEDDSKAETLKLVEQLERAKAIDVEAEKEILEEIQELSTQYKGWVSERKDVRATLKEHKALHDSTKQELAHLDVGNCPYCEQTLAGAKEKAKAAEKVIKNCAVMMAEINEQIDGLNDNIEIVEEKIEALESKASVDDSETLIKLESKIDGYAQKIEDLKKQENPHTETLEELLEVSTTEFDMDEINDLDDLLVHQNMVLKLLTKKDSFVRKNLINKSIPFLNKRLNHYLKELELPQTIEFKFDMTATVSNFGRKLDFGNLSAGQKSRVNLAMSFAFRDVLQNLHGQINICLLDEVLDVHLDAEGATIAANMLMRKGKQEGLAVYVISHKEELQSMFDRTVNVKLVDDFTEISYPDKKDIE